MTNAHTVANTLAADLDKAAKRERANLADDISELIKTLERLRTAVTDGRNGLSSCINLAQNVATIEHRAVRIDVTEASRREVLEITVAA